VLSVADSETTLAGVPGSQGGSIPAHACNRRSARFPHSGVVKERPSRTSTLSGHGSDRVVLGVDARVPGYLRRGRAPIITFPRVLAYRALVMVTCGGRILPRSRIPGWAFSWSQRVPVQRPVRSSRSAAPMTLAATGRAAGSAGLSAVARYHARANGHAASSTGPSPDGALACGASAWKPSGQ
jgi:hypothetical protein